MYPSLQISPGKDLNNGSRNCWVSHNASNTGPSKLLQQHARATAVACPSSATSSQAMSLTISSKWRQGCIESRKHVEPGAGSGEKIDVLRLMSGSPGCRGLIAWLIQIFATDEAGAKLVRGGARALRTDKMLDQMKCRSAAVSSAVGMGGYTTDCHVIIDLQRYADRNA